MTETSKKRSSDDIDKIYSQVDLSFVMYDSEDLNVKLALPNKLYESMAFKTPLLVSKKTFLSEKVFEYRIGFSWSEAKMDKLIFYLNSEKFKNSYNQLEKKFNDISAKDFLM